MELTKEAAITLINAKFGKGDAWSREQLERCVRNVEDGKADAGVLREILIGEFGIEEEWIRGLEESK